MWAAAKLLPPRPYNRPARNDQGAIYRALHPQPTGAQFERLAAVVEHVYVDDGLLRHYIVCNDQVAADDPYYLSRRDELHARQRYLLYYRAGTDEESHRLASTPFTLTTAESPPLIVERIDEHGGFTSSQRRRACAQTGYLVVQLRR